MENDGKVYVFKPKSNCLDFNTDRQKVQRILEEECGDAVDRALEVCRDGVALRLVVGPSLWRERFDQFNADNRWIYNGAPRSFALEWRGQPVVGLFKEYPVMLSDDPAIGFVVEVWDGNLHYVVFRKEFGERFDVKAKRK